MMGMMLNQCTYFSQAVERQVYRSHLVKVIYNAISQTFLCHCKNPETKSSFTWIYLNIDGTTMDSSFAIKPGTKLLGLNDKFKAALRNRLSEVIIINNRWTFHGIKRFMEKCSWRFLKKHLPVFLSVVTVADLLQLPPVRGKIIFFQFSDKDSMKHLLGLQL